MNIKDKVIVITGGGRGLGKAFALDLADRGAKLALADVDQENLERVKNACKENGIAFLSGGTAENLEERIDEGMRISGASEEIATAGRAYTKRTMPV